MRNLSFINMSYSLLQRQQVPSVLNFTLYVLWKLYFFKSVWNFLPFSFDKCLLVLVLWNKGVEARSSFDWKMTDLPLWIYDQARENSWESALCGGWRAMGWCKEPSGWWGFARAAWEQELPGAGGRSRDVGMEHCAGSALPVLCPAGRHCMELVPKN